MQLFIAEEKQVDLARQRKLSLNANIIYERAVEQGIQIDEQVLRDAPISVVLERSGVDLDVSSMEREPIERRLSRRIRRRKPNQHQKT